MLPQFPRELCATLRKSRGNLTPSARWHPIEGVTRHVPAYNRWRLKRKNETRFELFAIAIFLLPFRCSCLPQSFLVSDVVLRITFLQTGPKATNPDEDRCMPLFARSPDPYCVTEISNPPGHRSRLKSFADSFAKIASSQAQRLQSGT